MRFFLRLRKSDLASRSNFCASEGCVRDGGCAFYASPPKRKKGLDFFEEALQAFRARVESLGEGAGGFGEQRTGFLFGCDA